MTKGDKIRQARLEKALTMEELAKACGTTKQTIYKYETGTVTNIPSDRLELICEILDITPSYLFGWEESGTIEKLEKLATDKHDTDMLLEYFGMLNDKGRELALVYVKSLADMKDFQKESSLQTSTA